MAKTDTTAGEKIGSVPVTLLDFDQGGLSPSPAGDGLITRNDRNFAAEQLTNITQKKSALEAQLKTLESQGKSGESREAITLKSKISQLETGIRMNNTRIRVLTMQMSSYRVSTSRNVQEYGDKDSRTIGSSAEADRCEREIYRLQNDIQQKQNQAAQLSEQLGNAQDAKPAPNPALDEKRAQIKQAINSLDQQEKQYRKALGVESKSVAGQPSDELRKFDEIAKTSRNNFSQILNNMGL